MTELARVRAVARMSRMTDAELKAHVSRLVAESDSIQAKVYHRGGKATERHKQKLKRLSELIKIGRRFLKSR